MIDTDPFANWDSSLATGWETPAMISKMPNLAHIDCPFTLSYLVIASFNRRAGQLNLQLTFSSDHAGYIRGVWVARKPESSDINRATPSPSFL